MVRTNVMLTIYLRREIGTYTFIGVVFIRLRDCGHLDASSAKTNGLCVPVYCFRPRLILLLLNHIAATVRVCFPLFDCAEVSRFTPF